MPPVWTAGRLARLAREFVCDEASVDGGESAARYLPDTCQILKNVASLRPLRERARRCGLGCSSFSA
jgi:hypothetical protein